MKTFLNKNSLKTLGLICLVIILSSIASHAYAIQVDNTYTPLAPLPNLDSTNLAPETSLNFQTYVQYLYKILVALGGVAAVFMITWGGFDYMTSDAVQNKKDGINKIKNAIYGLLLILSSVLILQTISPQFSNVPAGLVPPANLTPPKEGVADWVTQMNKDLQKYNSQYQASLASVQQASDSITAKQSQISDLQVQIEDLDGTGDDASTICKNLPNPDSDINNMCGQIFNLQQDIASTTSNMTLQVKTGDMATLLASVVKSPNLNDPNFIANTQSQLDARYLEGMNQLTDPAAKQTLTNEYKYATAQLKVAQAMYQYAQDSGPSMYAAVGGAIATIPVIAIGSAATVASAGTTAVVTGVATVATYEAAKNALQYHYNQVAATTLSNTLNSIQQSTKINDSDLQNQLNTTINGFKK